MAQIRRNREDKRGERKRNIEREKEMPEIILGRRRKEKD